MAQKRFLEIGKIINTHGVRGEVKIEPWADSPEQLAEMRRVLLDETVYRFHGRVHGNFVIAKLEGIDTVEQAMTLKNKTVFIDRNDLRLPEGTFFIQDLLGLPVFSEEGGQIGILKDVLEYPAGRVYVVSGKEEHLIPEAGGFIRELDPEAGRIVVKLIEGM